MQNSCSTRETIHHVQTLFYNRLSLLTHKITKLDEVSDKKLQKKCEVWNVFKESWLLIHSWFHVTIWGMFLTNLNGKHQGRAVGFFIAVVLPQRIDGHFSLHAVVSVLAKHLLSTFSVHVPCTWVLCKVHW